MSCHCYGDVVLCRPNGTPMPITGKRVRRLWCFKCRARLRHVAMMLLDPEPTYYEPPVWWQCERCNEDRTEFGS